MKTKKILSILLALVMTLSLGAVAFAADDGYNWTPIPCSPAGLNNGDYYLDFTDLLTASPDITEAERAAYIAAYNGGTWYIDYDAKKLKGSIVDPNSAPAVVNFDPSMGTVLLMQYDVLRQVGATWTKMEKCQWADPLNLEVLGVVNGDKYVDISNAASGGNDFLTLMQQAEFYINPGSTLLEYKIVFADQTVYLPLMEAYYGSWLTVCPVKTYNDGCNWTLMPKSTAGLNDGDYYIDVQGYVDVMTDENGNPISDTEKQQQLQIWGNADYYADLSQMKLKITLHLPYQDENGNMTTIEQYVPSMYSANYIPLLLKVYHAPQQPPQQNPQNQSGNQSGRPVSIFQRISNFFQRVIDFFRNLFRTFSR
ncbi:MAG: hypothetical protein IJT27_03195 [Clostridia bacterium]|nr:hypothetical protein [Clostridia bacterium]MBQ7688206.1 hypothetical protein [Clostridia bacterium]